RRRARRDEPAPPRGGSRHGRSRRHGWCHCRRGPRHGRGGRRRRPGGVGGGARMNGFALVITTFLASGVEAVEALTIVLAAGLTRGWRSALTGVAAAAAILAVLVAALGPALSAVPLSALRVVVGGLLLAFGLQWLRKAVLRAGGAKALHDEDAIFARELAAAQAAARAGEGIDWYGFTLAFKGVLLEGLEVVFIVLTFGANAHRMPLAVVGAAAAVVATVAAGAVLHRPLARVPENTTKFVV